MTDPTERSRVLTLVFTDLADSTALKAERGDVPVGALIGRHRELVTRLADECSGRVIDWAGDGCFLTFETSSAGVLFALRLQQAHADDGELPGVRIGLHMGEVTEKEGPSGPDGPPRVEGLAVDLAARIQGLAKPGQVLMSSSVYHSARQRLGVEAFGAPILWQAYGDYAVKGFDDPLDICEAGIEGLSPFQRPEPSETAYPIVPHVDAEIVFPRTARGKLVAVIALSVFVVMVAAAFWTGRSTGPGAPDAGERVPTLAVLPLEDLNNDAGQAHFVDGMTEAIIAELAKIDSLNVISRTSVMRYKNTERPITEIAEELAVDRVVEGSVQREGDDVRITVQLIDGATDTHLWSNSYTNTITSVLKLQSEIALAIADEIRAVVTPEERTRINRAELVNREAYDLYLQGLSARADYSPIGQMRAHQLLSDSTAVDPDFAPAWSALASVNSALAFMAVGSPMRQMEAAFQCARRAMSLDESLGFPYIIQAVYSTLTEHNWVSVQTLVEKAVDLDPNDTDVLLGAANYNLIRGDWRAARRYAQKVISLDPNSEFRRPFAEMYMAWIGETERSVENLQSIVEDDPDNLMGRFALGVSLVKAGRYEEARTQFERYTELVPQASGGYVGQASAAAAAGDAAGARALIDEILGRFSRASLHATVFPLAYIYLGEIDTAFDWLEEAALTPNLQFYLVLRIVPFGGAQLDDPHFVAFRNHPRYRALIDQMGFPPLPPSHPGYAEEQEWLAQTSGTDNN